MNTAQRSIQGGKVQSTLLGRTVQQVCTLYSTSSSLLQNTVKFKNLLRHTFEAVIVLTRAMPGFRSSTDYDERKSMRVDCDKVLYI